MGIQEQKSKIIYSFLSEVVSTNDMMLVKELANISEIVNFKKLDTVLQIGDSNSNMYIVINGLFRAFYLTENGNQLIRKFYQSNEILGPFASILAIENSHITIDTLLGGQLLRLPYKKFETLRNSNIKWEKVSRIILEKNYVAREKRAFELQAFNATQRYQKFAKEYQGVLSHIAKTDIASYLGISPVSLSRIINK